MAPVSEQPAPQGEGGPAGAPPAGLRQENGGERSPAGAEGGGGAVPQPQPLPREEAAAAGAGEGPGPGAGAGPGPAEPPEGGWGWVVMLAAMWCNGAVFGIQNSCGVLFVSMLQHFGGSEDRQMAFKTGEEGGCFPVLLPARGVCFWLLQRLICHRKS